MGKKIFSFCMVMLICLAGTAFAQNQRDTNVEFEGIYWFSKLNSNVQIGINRFGATGTPFSLEKDFDLGDRDIPSGRFTWYTGDKSRLIFDYAQRDFSGTSVLVRDIQIRDTTFTAGAAASADLHMKLMRFGWIWQFITASSGKIKFGTLIEARAVLSDISVGGAATGFTTSTTVAAREETRANFGLPTFGLALDIDPNNTWNLFARGSGMSAGRFGHIADAEAGVKLIPHKNFSISGGYRWQGTEVKAPRHDVQARFTFEGPFAALSLRF